MAAERSLMPGDMVMHERECILWRSITLDKLGNVILLGANDTHACWSGKATVVIATRLVAPSIREHRGTLAALLLTDDGLFWGYENDVLMFSEVIR